MIRRANPPPGVPNPPSIWAIGGGKGGVGKSAIAANLAVAVAQSGRRVALVDADLGGANLHTLLGIPNPPRTLSEFVSRRVEHLDEIMIETRTEDLWLISGARALVEMANLNSAQKERLLRHVRGLPVDHVILDLGAGSSFNVLDFFLAARHGMLVVIPEATSIENAYHFLKAAFFRKLRRTEPRDRVRAAVSQAMADRGNRSIRSPRDLILRVAERDPEIGRALALEADRFEPFLVVNRVSRSDQRQLGTDMSTACKDYFGRNIRCVGQLEEDQLLARSVRERRPASEHYHDSSFVMSIRRMADILVTAGEVSHGR